MRNDTTYPLLGNNEKMRNLARMLKLEAGRRDVQVRLVCSCLTDTWLVDFRERERIILVKRVKKPCTATSYELKRYNLPLSMHLCCESQLYFIFRCGITAFLG